jgi:hypothetical protein
MERFCIGLDSWIIQDGNYRNFRTGQEARFALYFRPRVLLPATGGSPRIEHLHEARYLFNGRTLFRGDKVWVVDTGIVAYTEERSREIPAPDSWWSGELSLHVDPYFYFRDFARQPGIPPLIYRWRVERILLDITPMIEAVDEQGRKISWPDDTRQEYVEIPATEKRDSAYENKNCLLECTCLGDPTWMRSMIPEFTSDLTMDDVLGAQVDLFLTDELTQEGGTEGFMTTATVVQVNPDQAAILRLEVPVQFPAGSYEYAVAYPRYDSEGIACLMTSGQYFCSLYPLPAELALGPLAFQPRLYPRGVPLRAVLRRRLDRLLAT